MSKIKYLKLIKIEIIKIEIKVKIIVFHFINYLLKTNKMINIENKNKKNLTWRKSWGDTILLKLCRDHNFRITSPNLFTNSDRLFL